MLKGLLEDCVLEIISHGETYGYEITRRLNEYGFSDVVEGTVYAILQRLEVKKFVTKKKKESDLGPTRKFYSITEPGRSALIRFWNKWDYVAGRVNKLRMEKEGGNCE
jgi:DNA-binding PadR family transcriptional regulator